MFIISPTLKLTLGGSRGKITAFEPTHTWKIVIFLMDEFKMHLNLFTIQCIHMQVWKYPPNRQPWVVKVYSVILPSIINEPINLDET